MFHVIVLCKLFMFGICIYRRIFSLLGFYVASRVSHSTQPVSWPSLILSMGDEPVKKQDLASFKDFVVRQLALHK